MTDDDQNDDSKVVKLATDFNCSICHYNTSRKNDFNKHLATDKHKMMTDDDQKVAKVAKVANSFFCDCGRSYKYKQGLSVHRKKCNFKENSSTELIEINNNIDYKDMFAELMNQNKNLQNIIIEQNKNLSVMIPKVGNNNNNNTINQNLNINIFLNDKCKDAISIHEFIKNMEVSVEDLLFTKDKGLVKGISNLFIEHLNKIPFIQRPVWCSDKKRRKLYIKEKEWSEDKNNEKTKKAIKDVSNLQAKNINKYTKQNPNWMKSDIQKDNYIHIVKQVTDPINGNEEKVIDNIIDTIHFTPNMLLENKEN